MSPTRLVRPVAPLGIAVALLASLLSLAPAATTTAAQAVFLPFPGGQTVRIIQGYNGGTHRGRSQYGLDLVLANGSTSGAEVISPVDGSVSWAQPPGTGTGCMGIAFRDGSYSVTLCHVVFHRAFGSGESIARGQSLGTVGPAGTVGNAGTPHVHMELHRGRGANSPVPFSPPQGLPLEGVALAASGTYNEHGQRGTLVSSNGGGGGVVVASSSLPGPSGQTVRASAVQGPGAAAPVPAQSQRPAATAAPRVAGSTRAAVVNGTGSCLKVRKQPSADAPAVDCLPDGTEVAIVALASNADPRWRQVEGKGWVSSDYLKRTRAVVRGTDACLNVRESASTRAPLLGCLPEGTSVTIVEGPTTADGYNWYRIERVGSLTKGGWVVGQYLD